MKGASPLQHTMCPTANLQILPAAPTHLPALAALAQTAPDPWSEAGLAAALQADNQLLLAALHGGAPVGFACFLHLADTADLQQIVVDPAFRGQRIAEKLLQEGFAHLQALGAARCLLEVRTSNAPALALYRRLGFSALARRPGMYQKPPEDGFLMALSLEEAR